MTIFLKQCFDNVCYDTMPKTLPGSVCCNYYTVFVLINLEL